MTELTDFDDPEPDMTNEEISLLRRAGASSELIEMCEAEVEGIERADGKEVRRNSCLEESKKYIRLWEDLNDETAENFTHLGGSFFSEMWDGDLFAAYSHADMNNKALMLDVFGTRRINEHKPAYRTKVTV